MTRRHSADAARLAAALGAITAVTLVYVRWLHVSNPATVSTTFLLVVLVVAATSRLFVAVATSVTAMLCFNFFFLPPVGTLTIADPENWTALVAFLAVSLVASNLSAVARTRAREAIGRQNELGRLFELSRDVLGMTEGREVISLLARSIARRFDLEFVAIALPNDADWDVFDAGMSPVELDAPTLTKAFASAQWIHDVVAPSSLAADDVQSRPVGATRLVPLRVGAKVIGLLGAAGRPVEPRTLDTLASVVAMAIERAQLLNERKGAELARQSEELKTALLASIGHDLRTPLTVIRVAATNVKSSWLAPEGRAEQGDLILSEVERLNRLFENILEMARIDAGAIRAEGRWTHPSEIIAAAKCQVEHTLRRHTVDVDVSIDTPVRLDPRLTANALAHLLENAAHYAPPGSRIVVVAGRAPEGGLVVEVRDEGPGIGSADLPHLFERFYRGAAAATHASGTGMGLSIARGLVAAQAGRLWAENGPDGGARFTIMVPGATAGREPVALVNP
jgi:two-component system sensor histidine kinase KdpD